MLAKVSLLAGLACVSAGLVPRHSSDWCGSNVSSLSKDEIANQLAIQKTVSEQPEFHIASAEKIKIKVYMHIVGNTTAETQHLMNDTIVKKQMERLNMGFKNNATGFSFQLQSVDRYANPEWAAWTPGRNFPAGTRFGTKKDLNLYYLTHMPDGGPKGVGEFPWTTNSTYYADDHIRVSTDTVPGGAWPPFNEGDVTTHEVGHWLGLFHTFQFGCEGGDYVDDTPAQLEPSYGCPIGKDSCTYPGLDPIHNYMDYSSCSYEFTPGQITRMHLIWNKYRAKW